VDDDQELLEVTKEQVQHLGYRVLTTHQSKTVADIVKDQGVSLVISDVQMPNLSGLEMARHLQTALSSPPPVLLLSGNPLISKNKALESGAVDLLLKPLDIAILKDLLRRIGH